MTTQTLDSRANTQVYEYRHVVGFAETNVVGNVYFTNYLSWQGRCRELFLQEQAPQVADEVRKGLLLATTRCSCDYFSELFAFDEVAVRMYLHETNANRISLQFDYVKLTDDEEVLVARSAQQIACFRREGEQLVPVTLPDALLLALG